MEHIKNFGSFNESSNEDIIKQIKSDMSSLTMDGQRPNRDEDIAVGDKSVSVDFRDLGNWVHNEEDAWDREEDFREDDDQMIWAPGEYKKYMAKFDAWAKGKAWYSKVKLGLDTSEKNWCSFTVTLK
jgi:hypothetical protein